MIDRHWKTTKKLKYCLYFNSSDQSSCEYEYYYNKNGEKTARKPLAKPHKWKRNVAKAQRNFGQSYISTKGIERPEKKIKEPCNSILCRMKCTVKITQMQREEIFKCFWNISDLTEKRVFLIRHIEHIIPKYRRSNGLRSLNYAYFFEIDDKRIQVCKTFFTKTLDISHTFIKTAIKKLNSEKGCLEGERRGKWKNVKKWFLWKFIKNVFFLIKWISFLIIKSTLHTFYSS